MFVSASNPPFAAEYHVALPLRVPCKLVGKACSGGTAGLTIGPGGWIVPPGGKVIDGFPFPPPQAERMNSAPNKIAQETALITFSQRIFITSV